MWQPPGWLLQDTRIDFFKINIKILLLRSRRKVYDILLNQLLTAISERKVPETWEVIFLHRFHGWKDFLYACVYTRQKSYTYKSTPNLVYKQLRSRVRLSSKIGYVGSIGSPRGHHKIYILVSFEPQVQFLILRCIQIGFIKT